MEKPRLNKVTTGNVTQKKKGAGKKLSSLFISEEAGKTPDYLLEQVIVPAIIDTVVNIFTQGVEMIFYGKASPRRRGGAGGGGSSGYTAYGSISSRNGQVAERKRTVYDVDDWVFNNEADASLVLDTLLEYIDRYHAATVMDFYDAAGITDHTFNDYNYGWTDLSVANIQQYNGGWVINMPRPKLLPK